MSAWRERTISFLSHPFTLAIIIFVLAAIPRAILVLQFAPLTYSDSATYELPALIFREQGFFGSLVRPPLYPVFLGLVYILFGVSHFTAIVVQHIVVLIAILVVYMNLGIFFRNKWIAFFAALFRNGS